eukprot:408578_1
MEAKKRSFYDWIFVILIIQIYAITYFLRTAIAPIADVLEHDFMATSSQVGLCASFLSIGYFVMQIPGGILLELYTPELISLTSAFLVGISCFFFIAAPTIEIATVAQFMIGASQAPVAISILSIISKRIGDEEVSTLFGYAKFYTYFCLTSAQILQAYLYQQYDIWKEVFIACGGLCIFIGIISLSLLIIEYHCSSIHKHKHVTARVDSVELAQSPSINPVVYSPDIPLITPPPTRKCILFPCRNKYKGNKSISIGESLKNSAKNCVNWFVALYSFMLFFVSSGIYGLWMISYLMQKFDYSRSTATTISSSYYIASAVASAICGKLSSKYKKRKVFCLIGAVLMCGVLIAFYCPNTTPIFILLLSSIVAGAGFGTHGPPLVAAIREYNAYYNASDIAVSMIGCVVQMGGFLGQYVIGVLLDFHWKYMRGGNDYINGYRNYGVSDFDFSFLTVPIAFFFAFGAYCGLKETHAKNLDYSQ